MVWVRARSDEQKDQRRHVLLAAAARLYEAQPIEDVSLNAIAREANISKGNVYRYFESREDLFLQLTLVSLDRWSQALVRRLASLTPPAGADDIAQVFAETMGAHARFARLSSVLSTVLETNVSTEAVVRFKTQYFTMLEPVREAVASAMSDLDADGVTLVIEAAYFLMVGIWPSAHPAPAVKAALERPEFQAACIDFEPRFTKHLANAIRGLRNNDP